MKPSDDYYCEYVERCWKQHEEAMRPTHQLWKEVWQLYQSKQDWSKKMGWQSKCFVPKTFTTVERAAGEVKRAVLSMRKLFKFELVDTQEAETLQQIKEQLAQTTDPNRMAALVQKSKQINRTLETRRSRMAMREKQFKHLLAESDFACVYSEMMKPCCLLGLGVPKVVWSNGLNFSHLDAMNFAVSPDFLPYQKTRPPFMIERMELPLAEFKQRVKDQKGIWKQKYVRKIEEDAKKLDRFHQQRLRRGYGDYSDLNKRVELKYFWGDVINKEDSRLEENMLLVIANGKYLVRKQKNPLDHQKYPYVPTIPIVYPHRGTHGTSMIQPVVRIQYAINNIVNMVMDNLNFSVNKMYEYNPNDLLDATKITSVYPGKMVEVNTPSGQQAIREVVTSAIKRDVLYFYELLERERQESTSITEYNTGLPGKKSKTLGEVELKTAESRGFFDTIGRDLELNSLKPLLEMAYDLCSQFMGWESREGNYLISVNGVSIMLAQQEKIQQLSGALGMALQAPPLMQMTDLPELWMKLLSAHDLQSVFKDPVESQMVLNPEQKQSVQAKAQTDAKRDVARMSPEEKERYLNGNAGPNQVTRETQRNGSAAPALSGGDTKR